MERQIVHIYEYSKTLDHKLPSYNIMGHRALPQISITPQCSFFFFNGIHPLLSQPLPANPLTLCFLNHLLSYRQMISIQPLRHQYRP